jgi:predicted transcriptional regulator of viral defense system
MQTIRQQNDLLHEFEIATSFITPSSLSHFTAFQIHELTDQLPLKVFLTVPRNAPLPRLQAGNQLTYEHTTYKFILEPAAQFFGIMHIARGKQTIPVTDLERTLLDGLIQPQYCGGLREVIHAFTIKEFEVIKIVDYAKKLGTTAVKRLGWVLEHTGYTGTLLEVLEKIPSKGMVKLNASGAAGGLLNKRWGLYENI